MGFWGFGGPKTPKPLKLYLRIFIQIKKSKQIKQSQILSSGLLGNKSKARKVGLCKFGVFGRLAFLRLLLKLTNLKS